MTENTPSIPELYMAVRTLEHAISEAGKELKARVDELRDQLRLTKANFDTPYGPLIGTHSDASITFNAAGLLEWAQANAAHEVIAEHEETVIVPAKVRPSLAEWLPGKCVVDPDDGTVIYKETGEALPFATFNPESYGWQARVTPQAKKAAVAAVTARLANVVDLLDDIDALKAVEADHG